MASVHAVAPLSSVTSPSDLPQLICFIRHGRSLAQGTGKHERKSKRFLDCACSPTGVSQAYGIPNILTSHGGVAGVELIVVSPLTRALTTALLAFRHRMPEVPIVVHPECRERGSAIPENIPRPVSVLKNDPALAALPGFGDLDFGLLPDGWPANRNNSCSQGDAAQRSKHGRCYERASERADHGFNFECGSSKKCIASWNGFGLSLIDGSS